MKEYYNKASGYIMTWDNRSKRYVPKHRVVMERKIGRRLRSGEIVHHRDEVKTNNSYSNLKLEHNYQKHAKDHGHRWEGRRNPSFNMSRKHRLSLKRAWRTRKREFGPTGAKNPDRLRKLGYAAGKKTPH